MTLTKEQWAAAKENGLSRSAIYTRLRKGMTPEEAANTPKIIQSYESNGSREVRGITVTLEQIKIAESNGIRWDNLKKRIEGGMSVEKAINKPVIKRKKEVEKKDDMDPVKVVGRIKWLNAHECQDDPIVVPYNMLRKIEARGLTLDDVEEIKA